MGHYADKRRVVYALVGASVADDTEVRSIAIPAGREVEVYGLQALIRTPSPTASALVELVDETDTVLASVSIEGSAGDINVDSTTTFPLTIAQSTQKLYALKLDQDSGAGCDVDIELIMSDPGVAS